MDGEADSNAHGIQSRALLLIELQAVSRLMLVVVKIVVKGKKEGSLCDSSHSLARYEYHRFAVMRP
jgi:hypothetical protein